MRVISGSAKGTKLKTLSGTDVIRPTTDRVKESLFNIIQFDIIDARVLDVFCGSGALGIEALSRGAVSCDFVDSDINSINVAKSNLQTTHLNNKAELHRCDFKNYMNRCSKKFDFIFADPPYAAGYLPSLIETIEINNLLAADGKLIFETSLDTEVFDTEKTELYRTAVYGNTKILFYRHRSV